MLFSELRQRELIHFRPKLYAPLQPPKKTFQREVPSSKQDWQLLVNLKIRKRYVGRRNILIIMFQWSPFCPALGIPQSLTQLYCLQTVRKNMMVQDGNLHNNLTSDLMILRTAYCGIFIQQPVITSRQEYAVNSINWLLQSGETAVPWLL